MSVLLRQHWRRLLFVFVIILCLMLPAAAMAAHLKDNLHERIESDTFSVLILGDSQMAGAGWEGGYANCIQEEYPNAQVINLAQNGSLLSNGDIHAQWEYYLAEDLAVPDFVLLDGGINDLSYMRKEDFDEAGLALVFESLRSIIEQIHEANPDAHIIYTIIPPLGEWKDSESGPPSYDVQDLYWKYMNIVAGSYDYVTVLDLFSLNPFRFPCAECYRENFADAIHLNETGYRNTFGYIDNILVARLAKLLDE